MAKTIITESEEEIEDRLSYPERIVKKTRVVTPNVQTVTTPREYKTKKAIFRTYQVIWYILGVIEALLIFRLLLRFIAANPASGFTRLVYALSAPFALPFAGVVNPTIVGASVFEWSTLIAMAIWALIAWGIIELFQLIKPVDPVEVEETVDNPEV